MPAAKMKALVEERQRVTLCLLVGFVFVNHGFDLGGNEAADRGLSPRSEDFRLANRLSVQTDRYILPHCALRVSRISQNFSFPALIGGRVGRAGRGNWRHIAAPMNAVATPGNAPSRGGTTGMIRSAAPRYYGSSSSRRPSAYADPTSPEDARADPRAHLRRGDRTIRPRQHLRQALTALTYASATVVEREDRQEGD